MKRILFIHSQLVCGGVETSLYNLINFLDKNEFECTVLALQSGGEMEEMFLKSGISVIHPLDRFHSSKNPFRKIYNIISIKKIRQAMKTDFSLFLDLILSMDEFDLVVAYYNPKHYYKGKDNVFFVHCDVADNDDYKSILNDSKENFKLFKKIICVSKQAMKSFEEYTGVSDVLVCKYNTINTQKILENMYVKNDNLIKKDYICAVGRLSREKGYCRLIYAYKRLVDIGIKEDLVIVGEGAERQNLEWIIKGAKLENRVHLVGYSDNPYVYIFKARFLAISSYTEGISVVAAESIFLGVPVVTTKEVVSELFGNYQCGIVTGDDDDKLFEAMKLLLTDDKQYSYYKKQAVLRSNELDGTRMAKEIGDLFLSL